MVRISQKADLAARLKQKLRTLRSLIERRDTLVETIRGANATTDPAKVAAWIVGQASEWITLRLPAPDDRQGVFRIYRLDDSTAYFSPVYRSAKPAQAFPYP